MNRAQSALLQSNSKKVEVSPELPKHGFLRVYFQNGAEVADLADCKVMFVWTKGEWNSPLNFIHLLSQV